MIIIDTNLLIYSANRDSPDHATAKPWLSSALFGHETVGLSWHSLLAVVRLTTKPGIFRSPLSVRQAFDLIDSWLERPVAVILQPGSRHRQILRELLIATGTAGDLTSDAHLAALAIENEAELYTADADFARFRGLRWRNPLR